LKFDTSTTKSKCILDLIHSDVWQAPVVWEEQDTLYHL
jgi:hypothetical protein